MGRMKWPATYTRYFALWIQLPPALHSLCSFHLGCDYAQIQNKNLLSLLYSVKVKQHTLNPAAFHVLRGELDPLDKSLWAKQKEKLHWTKGSIPTCTCCCCFYLYLTPQNTRKRIHIMMKCHARGSNGHPIWVDILSALILGVNFLFTIKPPFTNYTTPTLHRNSRMDFSTYMTSRVPYMPVHRTSQTIYYQGGDPEQAIHWWLNVMTLNPWITAKFVTVCCSMNVVSKTLCSHFFGWRS